MRPSHLNPDLGRTNVLLSDEEADGVRQHLCTLETELHGLEQKLAILLVKRARTIDDINRCKIALAPHKKLPPELISRIFVTVFSVKHVGYIQWSRSFRSARSIPQVCSAWRKIAFATPELWEILFPGIVETKHKSGARGSRRWNAQRLKVVPKSGLLLKLSCQGMTPHAERMEHAINHCLIPNSYRIRHLDISIPYRCIHEIFDLPPGSFSELETLTVLKSHDDLVGTASPPSPLTERPGSSFVIAHRLRIANFSYMDDIGLRRLKLPWAQLTGLTLIGDRYQIVADVCLMVLSNCTSLVRCHFSPISFCDGVISPNLATLPHLPVISPTLQKLVLDFADLDYTPEITVFLRALVFPSLRRLVLSRTHSPFWLASDYITFLQPMSSTLETFEMIDSWHPELARDISGLLASIPHTKAITLSTDCFLSVTTMKKIACGDLLPYVEDFSFPAKRLPPALKMLKSRQELAYHNDGKHVESFSRLRNVTIFPSFEFGEEQRYLEMDGMDITLEEDGLEYKFPLTPGQLNL